jgi:cysteine desulfurase
MTTQRVYADYNATAPLLPQAREAMAAALTIGGNASSVHAEGRAAKRLLEEAREGLGQLLGAATPDRLTFVSGATEGLHLALESAHALGFGPAFVSGGEHDAVWALVQRLYPDLVIIPTDRDTRIDLAWLQDKLAQGTGRPLVVVQSANNETGAMMPLAEVAAATHAAGGVVLCDATQSFGKVAAGTFTGLADWLVVSSHKIGGPAGAGAIVTSARASLVNLRPGGGQELGARAGTSNVPAIAGFAAAAASAATDSAVAAYQARVRLPRLALQTAVAHTLPEALVIGQSGPHLDNTVCLALPGWRAEQQVMALDLAGAAVSAGAACSSGKVKTSRVLSAAGWDEAVAGAAIRASFGWNSQERDGQVLAEVYIQAAQRWRQRSGAHV